MSATEEVVESEIIQIVGRTGIAGEVIQVRVKVLTGKDEIKAVLAETVEFDLLVLGSTDHSLTTAFLGSKDDKFIAKAACSVLAVHNSSF